MGSGGANLGPFDERIKTRLFENTPAVVRSFTKIPEDKPGLD